MRIHSLVASLVFIPLAFACASSRDEGFDVDAGAVDGSPTAEGGALALDGAAHDDGGAGDAGGGNADSSAAAGDAAHLVDAAAQDGASHDASGLDGSAVFVPADPFTVDTSRPIATFAQLVSHFGPGATSVTLGTFTITSRTRTSCNAVTGCTPWTSPAAIALVSTGNDQFSNPATFPHALPSGGVPKIVLTLTNTPNTMSLALGAIEPQNAASIETFRCASIRSDDKSPDFNCSGDVAPLHPVGQGPSQLYFRRRDFQADSVPGPLPIWTGRINDDETFQFVTNLVPAGGDVTEIENLDQVAIYGHL